jgi:hypothetical protein
MRYRNILLCLALLGLQREQVRGQWLNYSAPGQPRTRDGKVNLSARAPRTRGGKPNLSGVWRVESTPIEEWRRILGNQFEAADRLRVPGMGLGELSKYGLNLFIDYKPGDAPALRPEAQAIVRERRSSGYPQITSELCLPIGFPMAVLLAPVFKLAQGAGITIMLLEEGNTYRQIYTDGRPLPSEPQPSWFGYSTGKWEGDTLLVETIGFNDKAWLDGSSHPRSESLRVTERYHRRDFGHLDTEMTFDDPKMYTKAFSIRVTNLLQADSDILENVCAENEKDRVHTKSN